MLIASSGVAVALSARITTPVDGGCDLAKGCEMSGWALSFFCTSYGLTEHAQEFVDVPSSERWRPFVLPVEKAVAPIC
jgi:hypothetical protein